MVTIWLSSLLCSVLLLLYLRSLIWVDSVIVFDQSNMAEEHLSSWLSNQATCTSCPLKIGSTESQLAENWKKKSSIKYLLLVRSQAMSLCFTNSLKTLLQPPCFRLAIEAIKLQGTISWFFMPISTWNERNHYDAISNTKPCLLNLAKILASWNFPS